MVDSGRSESPLYQSTATGSGMGGRPQSRAGYNSNPDLLSLEPSSSSSALMRGSGQQPDQQLLIMEEAQPTNSYIQQRGEAIESIERTINELGSIFGQLAGMVSEVSSLHRLMLRRYKCDSTDIYFQQSEMIQRIDANTEVRPDLSCAPRKAADNHLRMSSTMFKALKENCLSTGRAFQAIAGWWPRCLVF